MARIGGPKDFWGVLKSVSVSEIAREANRPLSVCVVGSPELRAQAITGLYHAPLSTSSEEPQKAQSLPEPVLLRQFDSFVPESGFPASQSTFDLIIHLDGPRDPAPAGAPVYSIGELGGWDRMIERILDDRPELSLALARNLPVFRPLVAQRIIGQTATTNAQWALLTGITSAIPLAAILLPVNSLSDIVVLTKNQAMMVLRL
ncbi:MAG TPA: hypothetical protein VGS41_03185, partial [Chthonomonadales bacterium]|nr:hypothetical protein [Chthonomonadales bacterium]